jgi:hypothetical protein
LRTSFEQLLLYLLGDRVETDMGPRKDGIPLRHSHGHDAEVIKRMSEKETSDWLRCAEECEDCKQAGAEVTAVSR